VGPAPASPGYSITVSGGVSLGAYEAGQLAYTLSSIRAHAGPTRLRLATGASAGSLNALLSILAACGDGEPTAPGALYWDTWIPIGFEQLLVPAGASSLGAFSRSWLDRRAGELERRWAAGLDASCDVVLGISATRLEPRVLRTAGGRLPLPRVDEKFVVRIRGRGPGRPPLATNFAPGELRHFSLLLTTPEGEVPFPELRDLLFASMAFPMAFSPQALRICERGRTATPGVCLPAEATATAFVDGGVFDNGPLRLAVQLAAAGLSEDEGRLRWGDRRPDAERELPPSLVFGYLNVDATEYPVPAGPARSAERGLPRQLVSVLGAFVESARAKELAILLEERPEVAEQVVFPRRRLPAAGAPLNAFVGFFETEFRRFDFALGMYDAERSLERRDPAGALDAPRRPALEPEPAVQRLACMRAVVEALPEAREACRPEALADFRALLQASLDQLYDACAAPAGAPPEPWDNPHCARAAAGAAPPHVPFLAPRAWPDWRRRAGDSDLTYSVRLLAAYGFRFDDLGAHGDGALALRRIREALGRAGEALAAVQPGLNRRLVAFGAKVAADQISYLPPRQAYHLTLGPTESELGLSLREPTGTSSQLRVAGVVGLRGLGALLSSHGSEPFAVIAAAGLELQPTPGSSTLSQVRLGLRGGWLAASRDRYGGAACVDRGRASVSRCSRPVVQGLLGWTVLERIRLQVVGEWFPGSRTRETAWAVAPGVGFELGR
jgi:hypothetical protein